MSPSFRKFFGLRERKPGSPGQVPEALSHDDISLNNTIGDKSGDSLFAFVDLKDPFTPSEVAGEDLPGPILSVMGARRFESLFLFHTPHIREKALATQSEVSRRYPECRIHLRELPVSDPKDYSSVMARLAWDVPISIRQIGTCNNYVCVSSGTAEMRAAWFVLTVIGVLPAKLLQVGTPLRPLFGQANVREVVDTSDRETIFELLMPRPYVSPHYSKEMFTTSRSMEVARTPGTSHRGDTGKASSSVDNALDQDFLGHTSRGLGLVPGAHHLFAPPETLDWTHRDLNTLVAEGKFREDLLYRLNVVPIDVPPLRERAADIPLLVEYFIDRFGKKAGKKFGTIDKKSLRLLQAYEWPGNIRELQNVIERAVILCKGEPFSVDETWLRRELPVVRSRPSTLNCVLARQEKEMIEAALAECYGSRARRAQPLGLPRTFDSKIKRFKINKYRFKVPRAS